MFHGKSIFTSVQMDRFEGYQQAMEANGLDSVKEYIYSDRPLSYQPIFRMYGSARKFTAVVLATTWDVEQLGELVGCIGADGRVDVAAFDSFSLTYPLEFQQNTVQNLNEIFIMEQDHRAMGQKAFQLLYNTMQHAQQEPQRIYIKPRLLEPQDMRQNVETERKESIQSQ